MSGMLADKAEAPALEEGAASLIPQPPYDVVTEIMLSTGQLLIVYGTRESIMGLIRFEDEADPFEDFEAQSTRDPQSPPQTYSIRVRNIILVGAERRVDPGIVYVDDEGNVTQVRPQSPQEVN